MGTEEYAVLLAAVTELRERFGQQERRLVTLISRLPAGTVRVRRRDPLETEPKTLLSIRSAAHQLDLSPSTVRRMISDRLIKTAKRGKRLGIPMEEIRRLSMPIEPKATPRERRASRVVERTPYSAASEAEALKASLKKRR